MRYRPRIEQSFAEAAGPPIDVSATVKRATIAINLLIDNVARRIEWHEQENRRLTRATIAKGEPPPAPVSLMGELEGIGRVVLALKGLRLDLNPADPDAGAAEICRILQLAREDFSNVKRDSTKAGKDTVPPEAGEGGAGDEISQNPTLQAEAPGIERRPALSNLCVSHGKVRRGSG